MDTKQRPSLTTAQKTAAALAVACPEHGKQPGQKCPTGPVWDGACMARRAEALDPR